MQEVLRVRFDFSKAAGISTYGWRAVGFAILGMIIYMAGLMCSHIAAFHVQAQMRTAMMNHIMTLPLGYIESEGTGKIRKIVTDSSAATEGKQFMSRLLVIGCGGVASVAIRKCCQNSDVFTEIMIASRTKEKCDPCSMRRVTSLRRAQTMARFPICFIM